MRRKKTDIVQLKVRLREPLRVQIEKAARRTGISMNAEIVGRLERSFVEETNFESALSQMAGEEALFRAMLMGLGSLRNDERLKGKSWIEDPGIRSEFAETFKDWLDGEAERATAGSVTKVTKAE